MVSASRLISIQRAIFGKTLKSRSLVLGSVVKHVYSNVDTTDRRLLVSYHDARC